MKLDRLRRTREALASVHSLRVARARSEHMKALHALEVAERTYQNTHRLLAQIRRELEAAQADLATLGSGQACRADELMATVTRLERQRTEETHLMRRVDIARKAVERAEAEARRMTAALHRALHAQEQADRLFAGRITAYRMALQTRADERVVDELAARRRMRT